MAALVFAWLAGRGDWTGALALVRQQGQGLVWLGMAVCALSLVLRAARWRLLLLRLGHRLSLTLHLRVYLAGIALSATPGKIGETWRSALLRGRGVPVSRSLAAFVTDRLSDVIGLAALGGLAAWASGRGAVWLAPAAASLAAASLLVAAGLRHARVAVAAIAAPATQQSELRWRHRLAAPALAWAGMWRWPLAAAGALIGASAYGIQAAFMVGCVRQMGEALGWADGLAVFACATLLGAASMLPGGLGAMDLALVLQLQALGVARPEAMAATLITRLCTLGFGWLAGILALGSFSLMRAAPQDATSPTTGALPSNPAP